MLILTFFLLLVCWFLARAYLRHQFSSWTRQGIPQRTDQAFPFGDFGSVFRQQQSQTDFYRSMYDRTKEHPLFGIYILLKPMLVINDHRLVRDILTRDFQYFHDHNPDVQDKDDPLSGNLFSLTGERWQRLRTSLLPAFTPSKLRGLFQNQLKTATTLQNHIGQFADSGMVVDMADICSRYASDGIASMIFGIEADALNDPKDEFFRVNQLTIRSSLDSFLRWIVYFLLPELKKRIGMHLCCAEVERFMCTIVQQTAEYREQNNVCRNDVMQLLLQLRNTGLVADDGESWHVDASSTKSKLLSMEEIVAIIFTFFVAGGESMQSAMTFCLLELGRHPEMQRKLQEEIDRIESVTYDSVSSMKYLDCCVNETLRMYPPLSNLYRICTKDYAVNGSSTIIRQGTTVLLPVFGLQRDENFYSNPDSFDPERFLYEDICSGRPFYPFGDGPRECLAARMGKLAIKIGLTLLLAEYTFALVNEEDIAQNPKFDPKYYIVKPKDGVRMLVTKRKNSQSI